LPLKGEGKFILCSQPDRSYLYQLEGSQLQLNDSLKHYGLIKGSKQNKKWTIEQAQWDDWNAYAELHQEDKKWHIPFLGLKIGQTLLLGLEGDWLQEETCLKAKLKYCQVDLFTLKRFSSFQSLITQWWPKGILSAKGEFEWHASNSNVLEGCQAILSAEVTDFNLRDCPFKIANQFQINLKPHFELSLENIQIEMNKHAYIHLKQFNYHLHKKNH